ncbi:MAG: hypothetical protein KDI64_15770, partial [Candidatus Accumulibacter sp.]|nr:hypothetical protein [Accumulibacter sp.]
MPTREPLSRRLDLKAVKPTGGGTEFLSVALTDDGDRDRLDGLDLCTLPLPDQMLTNAGLTVEDFLWRWRAGSSGLDAAAREYGKLLYEHVLRQPGELADAWQRTLDLARTEGRGIRLEIRCPAGNAHIWQGLPLAALPFELMCDSSGYLFRRPGWSTVRRVRGQASRALRLQQKVRQAPSVQVAWANVTLPDGTPRLDDELFTVHEASLRALGDQIDLLPSLSHTCFAELRTALEQHKPHVLIWIGHGVESGGGLLFHNAAATNYLEDFGIVASATDIAVAAHAGEVDVALLWSCHGAGSDRLFDLGVAEALLDPDRGDLVAVLASFSALDAATVANLSRSFTEALGLGDGNLEAAIARARGLLSEQQLTWARPILFLRTPLDGAGPMIFKPVLEAPDIAPTSAGSLRWTPALPAHTPDYVDHQHRLRQLEEDLVHR